MHWSMLLTVYAISARRHRMHRFVQYLNILKWMLFCMSMYVPDNLYNRSTGPIGWKGLGPAFHHERPSWSTTAIVVKKSVFWLNFVVSITIMIIISKFIKTIPRNPFIAWFKIQLISFVFDYEFMSVPLIHS